MWCGTDPGSPPASIMLASVTSLDQTSYCHFRSPRTPHSTRPVCKPTRMFRFTSVASATDLIAHTYSEKRYILLKFCTLVVFILTPTGVDKKTSQKSKSFWLQMQLQKWPLRRHIRHPLIIYGKIYCTIRILK